MKAITSLSYLFIMLIALINPTNNYSQEKISMSIYQDVRLVVLGNKKEHNIRTLNVLIHFKIQGKQNMLGYFVFIPEYEKANLPDMYQRLSLNIGYTFNSLYSSKLMLPKNLEFTIAMGYGITNRFSKNSFNYSISGEASYKINEWLKVGFVHQLTERTDLLFKYHKNKLKYSFFFGLEISPFIFFKNKSNSMSYVLR